MPPPLAGCLICEGNLDDTEEEERIPQESYEQSAEPVDLDVLRKHLVERHSRFVATSFLNPNLADAMYMWLLSCARYEMPVLEDEEVEEDEDVDEETPCSAADVDDLKDENPVCLFPLAIVAEADRPFFVPVSV
ncbi:unnamed protein product [Caenorhabditis auriculariae]|uniref:Uncharacterized protein n=1 Tax=Caenorhabditis auriculariae TaxID=2777116 RepID=A0A8S1H4T5_9PELO|nr:unnamed protein product [Caenorhabditis auriculariae]